MDFHVLHMLRLNKKKYVDVYVSIDVHSYGIDVLNEIKRLTNSIYSVIIF